MVDIERNNYRKGVKGLNLLNNLFRKRSKRNLNEMVRCLSGNSNEKLDQLLSKSMNNMNELNNESQQMDSNQNYDMNNLRPDKIESVNLYNVEDNRRRLSTPIMVPMQSNERKEAPICKKLSLKMRRSFSPKSKLIISQSQKKMSLDQELLEHYNQLSTECNQSYMSLVSNSPISPRIKSIDDDIEAITLSRQDNPWIQSKLEKLSHYTGVDHDILSISNLSLNNAGPFVNYSANNLNQSNNSTHSNQSTHSNPFSQSNKTPSISSEELDEILNFSGKSTKEDNLHQHLIRSPPPHFPVDFSSFIFPAVGSPLRSLSEKYNNSINSDTTSIKTPNLFLSPLKTPKSSRLSNQQLSKEQNLFFSNLTKNKLKNLNKSNDSHLSTNENDVELIITVPF